MINIILKKIKALRKDLLFIVSLSLSIIIFTLSLSLTPLAGKVFAQVPSMVCLGTCPTPTTATTNVAAEVAATTPTTGVSITPTANPSITQTQTPSSTPVPCKQPDIYSLHSADNTEDIEHNRRRWRGKGGKGTGGSQGIIQLLLNLLQQILQLIQQLLGIGGGGGGGSTSITPIKTTPMVTANPCPSNTPGTQPTSSTTATTAPSSSVTTTVAPTQSGPTPTAGVSVTANPSNSTAAQPIALVYNGPGTSCCSQPLATMIQNDTKQNFKVMMVGPNESTSVQAGLALPNVKLYAQPGADGDENAAYTQQQGDTTAIQNFVNNGGHFLGICMGAYLADGGFGSIWTGFNLLPFASHEYITEQGADVASEADALVNVTWGGAARKMYFQDGASWVVSQGTAGVTVLATYSNGQAAALVATHGNGKVGVSGPHPELSGLGITAAQTQDLGNNLIDTLMQ